MKQLLKNKKTEFSPGDIVYIRKKWGKEDLGIVLKNLYRGSAWEFDKFEVLSGGSVGIYSREELDIMTGKKDG